MFKRPILWSEINAFIAFFFLAVVVGVVFAVRLELTGWIYRLTMLYLPLSYGGLAFSIKRWWNGLTAEEKNRLARWVQQK